MSFKDFIDFMDNKINGCNRQRGCGAFIDVI